jgi:hypothetical protein
MNIYNHSGKIVGKQLDSKFLFAIMSVSRGYEIVILNFENIIKRLKR